MNKDTTELVRALRKQGAQIETRKGGSFMVYGPKGKYILHRSMSCGASQAMTRKHLRRIGFTV